MKTTSIAVALVLSLTVLPGCGDKSTPGGETGQKKAGSETDNTFKLEGPSTNPSVTQGQATPFTIGIKRYKNFDQDVVLTFEGQPSGVTFEPAKADLKHSDADARITVKAGDDANPGTYPVKVMGTPAKGATAATEFKVTVNKKAAAPNYSVNLPSSTHVKQGETKEVAISVKRDKGFDEDVTFKFDALPPGLTVDPATATVKNGETETKVLVKAAGDAGIGDKTIKVIATPTKSAAAQLDLKVTVEKK